MQDTRAVSGGEPLREVERDRRRVAGRHGQLELGDAAPAEELRHEVGAPRHVAELVDREHVGVLQAGDGERFHPEADARFLGGLSRRDLERHGAVEQRVVRQPDVRRRAPAE